MHVPPHLCRLLPFVVAATNLVATECETAWGRPTSQTHRTAFVSTPLQQQRAKDGTRRERGYAWSGHARRRTKLRQRCSTASLDNTVVAGTCRRSLRDYFLGHREKAVREHDGEVVGAFGYRRLGILEHLACFTLAAVGVWALVRLQRGPWAAAGRRVLTLPLLGAALAACWLLISFTTVSWCIRLLLLVTCAAPRLLRPEDVPPSPWSCFRTVGNDTLRVHMLRWFRQSDGNKEQGTQAGSAPLIVHCCHGFGASGLSYEALLPVLPKALAPCRAVLCPDSVGFGLTERPILPLDGTPKSGVSASGVAALEPLELYSLKGNAAIAKEVLDAEIAIGESQGDSAPEQIVVLGHSMGAITASALAIEQAAKHTVTLVLVSPAFLTGPSQVPAGKLQSGRAKLVALRLLRQTLRGILQIPGMVYSRRFWEKGLASAAYDPRNMGSERFRLQVQRYRWPSLCKGWALGLANFVTSRLLGGFGEDGDVLRQLVDTTRQPGGIGDRLKVLIVTGSDDRAVPVSNTRRLQGLLRCPMVVMEGLGHVAYEEDPDGFTSIVTNFVRRGELPQGALV